MAPNVNMMAVWVVGLSLLGAPVGATETAYSPTPYPEKSFEDLQRELEAGLRNVGRYVRVKPFKGFSVISYQGVSAVRVGSDWAEIEFEGALVVETKPTDGIFLYRLDYAQLARLDFDGQICAPRYIALPDGMEFRYAEPVARSLCDTLFNLGQRYKIPREQAEPTFAEQAARYRAMAVKPAITEDLRRLIVQAELLRERKDYFGAADRYRKVVELDPVAYPAAWFNLALLYEQQERYLRAVESMKKYLVLQPDAPDARAAQDKIYGWEMLAGE